jgi:1,2-diacylglycerol 3-beta-galactosyltransferase
MNLTPIKPPHILFIFSDTGGGHRSASEAMIEALQLEYGNRYTTEMVDIFKDYAPRPLNIMPDLYPRIVRAPQIWGLGYRLSNGPRRSRWMMMSTWPYVRRSIRRMIEQHPSNLIVSVHPLANIPVLSALGPDRPPYVTVVTDLVTTHALWYHRRADLCIVPTQQAYERALRFGLRPEQVLLAGLPVADRFCTPAGNKDQLRQRFGWEQDRPLVLLVGGGEGMGPLEKTAHALVDTGAQISLVVIAGRNQALKTRLENTRWPIPVHIFGFVREMPDFMRAADILVTKAGPGTICEAMNAALPIIMYSHLPGQEDGNITYVEEGGAGVWAPRPDLIAAVVRDWIDHPDKRLQIAAASQKLARPQAARQIAHILAGILESRSVIESQGIPTIRHP